MNNAALKQKILKHLSILNESRNARLMVDDLNMPIHTLRAMCDELQNEGYIIIGAPLEKYFDAMIADKGRHLLDNGGYKNKKSSPNSEQIKFLLLVIGTLAGIAGAIAAIVALLQ